MYHSIFENIVDPWDNFADYKHKILTRRREQNVPVWVGSEHPDYARYLYYLAKRLNALRILEIGFQCGGSGFGLASGLAEGGIFIGIDNEESENARGAMEDFQSLFPHLPVQFLIGNSDEVLATVEPPFDIIHLDHEKSLYLRDLLWMINHHFITTNTVVVFHDTTTSVPEPTKKRIQELFEHKIILHVIEGAWVCWGYRGG